MAWSIEEYAAHFSSPLSPLLEELLRFTEVNHPKAHMVSGVLQGQFLRMISKLLQPNRILEIGTFTGFSALCLAEGLAKDGLLYTIEMREADATIAQSYFEKSGYGQQIQLLVGDAAILLPQLQETWDLVFIDADKTGYAHYFDLVLPNVKNGGIILADNVLFHGEVLKDDLKGKNAKAIAAFNQKVKQTAGIDCVLLPLRDGLIMIRKNG